MTPAGAAAWHSDTAIRFECMIGNPHVRAVESLFGPIPYRPDLVPPGMRFVFLCFTNRSGSNHLAEALQSDGRLNMAGEFFNADAIEADTRLHGHASFAEYLCRQVQWRQVGGRFVAKVAPAHLELLGRAGVLDAAGGGASYIHINRADRLAQAISHGIAEQTQQWTSATRADPARRPRYARSRIAQIMQQIDEGNALFDRFFAINGIAAARIGYEGLIADPEASLAVVGSAIGVPGLRVVPTAMRLTRQAGMLNQEWRARFDAGQ